MTTNSISKRALLLAVLLGLLVPSSAIAAAGTRSSLPPAHRLILERGLAGLQARNAQLLIDAVARAPRPRQTAIVNLVARVPAQARPRMAAVLDNTLGPLGPAQAQAVADALVGVASPGEQQFVGALAAQVRANVTASLPPRLRQAVLTVYGRVTPATQLVVMVANGMAAAQIPQPHLSSFLQSIEYLLSLIPPQYAQYGLSLVADLVGLATPADEQRVAQLIAYLQTVVRINNLNSSLAASIHEATIYQGQRWACVLGGGDITDSVPEVINGRVVETSFCLQ